MIILRSFALNSVPYGTVVGALVDLPVQYTRNSYCIYGPCAQVGRESHARFHAFSCYSFTPLKSRTTSHCVSGVTGALYITTRVRVLARSY